jgi:hypothetical protein
MMRLSSFACAVVLVACGGRSAAGDLADDTDSGEPPGDGGGSSSMSDGPEVTPVFPTGVFSCQSSLSAAGTYQGTSYDAVSGGNGTLTVTQSGRVVTAVYADDLFVNGTLAFVATTDRSAEPAAAGQTLTFLCPAPFGMMQSQDLSIASGSLTMDGTTLFLSFSGTATPASPGPSACDGVKIPGTLTCTTGG